MIRLFVAVWKLTVAIAWQKATTAMMTTLVTRRSAIRQKPSEPTGIGLSQASRPKAKPAEARASTATTVQYRRRARGVGKAPARPRAAGAAGAAAGPAHRVEIAVEGEERVLPVVRTALDEGRQLHLSYYVPGRDETTERDVDPVRLLLVQGRSYLEGWCRRAEGVRLFRLDRVADLQVLDAPAEPPADVETRDLSEGLFRPSPDDALVTP